MLYTPGTSQCTITLSSNSQNPLVIDLSSDNSNESVPPSVQIPAGANSATFTASVGSTATGSNAILTATANGTASTVLSYNPTPVVKSIVCTPVSVPAKSTVTCSVTLTSAPQTPQSIVLTSSSSDVSVPAALMINANQTTASFNATAASPSQPETVVITAAALRTAKSAIFSLLTSAAPLTISAPALIAAEPGDNVKFTVAPNSPQGLVVSVSTSNLPPGASFNPALDALTWTPMANQMGSYPMTFTATDSSGATATALVKVNIGATRDAIAAIINAANPTAQGVCSPGALANISGTGFTSQPAMPATGFPLPFELAGVQVSANGQPLPLLFVSSTSINFQCPLLSAGTSFSITVQTEDGTSLNALQNTMPEAAPGIYTLDRSGTGQGSIFIADSTTLAMPFASDLQGRPAHLGESITISTNGLGPTGNGTPELGSPAALPVPTIDSVQVVIGGVTIAPSFSGLAASLVGTYNVSLQLPENVPVGSAVPVYLQVTLSNGTVVTSNQVTMAIDATPSKERP